MLGRISFASVPCHAPLWRFAAGALTTAALTIGLSTAGRPATAQGVNEHLARGNAQAARRAAEKLTGRQRDQALAEVAVAQLSGGDLSGAAETFRGIRGGEARAEVLDGAGGGAVADFQPLMELIQRTVVPDTWEALGGPSTMAPYPGGIEVDPSGTVRVRPLPEAPDGVAELKTLLRAGAPPADAPASAEDDAAADPDAWRSPSAMRCLSLRRLVGEIIRQQHAGRRYSDDVRYLAGLSSIQYLHFTDHDVILAGRVGGIERRGDWYRDRTSMQVPIAVDALAVCLASAFDGRPFGCTIDPTAGGLRQAGKLAAKIGRGEIPVRRAADALASALGPQRVSVFGTAGDTATGYVMVEADQHMKRLALGHEEMPHGVQNYLDIVGDAIDQGLPKETLLRLWFTSEPIAARADRARSIFELAGRPLRLSGKNHRPGGDGQRGATTVDFRTERFVKQFNRNWMAIRGRYPVYAALESLYRGASVAELLSRHATTPSQRGLLTTLALLGGGQPAGLTAPRQIRTIAAEDTLRRGRKRHHLLIASGGVSIAPGRLVPEEPRDYPRLESLAPRLAAAPPAPSRWWWDINRR